MKKSLVAFKNGRKIDPVSMIEWNRIMDLFDDGTKLTVTIENFVRKKSLGQLNLVHKLFAVIANELGYFPHQIKEHIKNEYGVWESLRDRSGNEMTNIDTGEIIMVPKSLADYTVQEMTGLINVVYEFAEERQIRLPHPEELRNNNLPLT